MTIKTELLVALKGADLSAATAVLTLKKRMGYGGNLIGLKRFDFFRFDVNTAADGNVAVDNLKRALDRQSTFYNRNKHLYSLSCQWDGDSHAEGVARSDIRSRWMAELAKSLQKIEDRDFDGNDSSKTVSLDGSIAYLAEVMVEDHDDTEREAIAARVQRDLDGFSETEDTTVVCHNRATVWWLAIAADSPEAAREMAKKITVTDRRDTGLLMIPNYQSAEFASVTEIDLVSS